eukprot:7144253-Prymnesium_polylepis.1
MMPNELYEAGQRVEFSAKVDGRYLNHKYLIRMCAAEVFNKQDAPPPKPDFVSADVLGGHLITSSRLRRSASPSRATRRTLPTSQTPTSTTRPLRSPTRMRSPPATAPTRTSMPTCSRCDSGTPRSRPTKCSSRRAGG